MNLSHSTRVCTPCWCSDTTWKTSWWHSSSAAARHGPPLRSCPLRESLCPSAVECWSALLSGSSKGDGKATEESKTVFLSGWRVFWPHWPEHALHVPLVIWYVDIPWFCYYQIWLIASNICTHYNLGSCFGGCMTGLPFIPTPTSTWGP